jgi:hypothetical protein
MPMIWLYVFLLDFLIPFLCDPDLQCVYCEHCNENPIYVFSEKELHVLSPSFHIHVSISDLYIPRIGPHISYRREGRPIAGIHI